MSFFRFACVALVFAGLIGCSGPRAGTTGDAGATDAGLPDNLDLSQYEEFDASAYEEAPPAIEVDVEHDVPDRLMAGRAGSGGTQTLQGYRIQIFSAQDRPAANDQVTEALEWWDALKENLEPWPRHLPQDLPVYVVYKQPYYRVRVGNFTSRSEASQLMSYLSERFPEAFVVPDQVTVTR